MINKSLLLLSDVISQDQPQQKLSESLPTTTLQGYIPNLANQDLFKQDINQDIKAQKSINNQLLKTIFHFLLNFSVYLFTLGIFLTLQDGGLTQQSIIEYIKKGQNKIYLIVLIVVGVTIITSLREIKEDNKIQAKSKKKANFFVDILRTTFYIISLVFAGPYVYTRNDAFFLQLAFVIFIFSTILFIVRKSLKWYYYLGKGKDIIDPWETKNITDEKNIEKVTKLIDAKRKKEKALQQKKKDDEKKELNRDCRTKFHQKIDQLQKKLKQNDVEREKIASELRKIIQYID